MVVHNPLIIPENIVWKSNIDTKNAGLETTALASAISTKPWVLDDWSIAQHHSHVVCIRFPLLCGRFSSLW